MPDDQVTPAIPDEVLTKQCAVVMALQDRLLSEVNEGLDGDLIARLSEALANSISGISVSGLVEPDYGMSGIGNAEAERILRDEVAKVVDQRIEEAEPS